MTARKQGKRATQRAPDVDAQARRAADALVNALIPDEQELATQAGRARVKARLRLGAKAFAKHGCANTAAGFEQCIAAIEAQEAAHDARPVQ